MTDTISLEDLLRNKETEHLQWVEPWPSMDKDGKIVDAYITISASVQHCINLRRDMFFKTDPQHALSESEENLLYDFMVVHWAAPKIPPR